MNPQITKVALSEMLEVLSSTLKSWLKANNVLWAGHSINGHWDMRGINEKSNEL